MLLISFWTLLLVILNVLPLASYASESNQIISDIKINSENVPMSYIQPPKLLNHQIMSSQHEILYPLKHPVGQANYFDARRGREKTFSSVLHFPRLPNSNMERVPSHRSMTLSENGRRYVDSALEQPRPFNFPLEEPHPSEFKKTHNSRKENIYSKAKRINNIQDILRQEYIANRYRMPIGIHISGSFKNFQRSGISNFFQKHAHPQYQMSPSQLNFQQFAPDPFYQYKPKSLSDINSLAIRQFGLKRPKKKNKANFTPNLIFQQIADRPKTANYYLDSLRINNSLNPFGGSQPYMKNEPFSLKLEVYPIRSGKKASVIMNGSQLPTTIRPTVHNSEALYPQIPYVVPLDSGINHMNYMKSAQLYKARVVPATTQSQTRFPMDLNVLATHFDEKNNKEKLNEHTNNQLMVQLNVFPKKKGSSVAQNHLYDIISADVHERRFNNAAPVRNSAMQQIFNDCETGEQISEFPESSEYQQSETKNVGIKYPLGLGLNETTKFIGIGSDNITDKTSTFRFPIENLMQFQPNDAVI